MPLIFYPMCKYATISRPVDLSTLSTEASMPWTLYQSLPMATKHTCMCRCDSVLDINILLLWPPIDAVTISPWLDHLPGLAGQLASVHVPARVPPDALCQHTVGGWEPAEDATTSPWGTKGTLHLWVKDGQCIWVTLWMLAMDTFLVIYHLQKINDSDSTLWILKRWLGLMNVNTDTFILKVLYFKCTPD